MTREHAKELLPIIQAFADGKDIQFNEGTDLAPKWVDVVNPTFMGCSSNYRIKPKPREFSIATSTEKNKYHGSGVVQVSEGLLPKTLDSWDVIHVREILD